MRADTNFKLLLLPLSRVLKWTQRPSAGNQVPHHGGHQPEEHSSDMYSTLHMYVRTSSSVTRLM